MVQINTMTNAQKAIAFIKRTLEIEAYLVGNEQVVIVVPDPQLNDPEYGMHLELSANEIEERALWYDGIYSEFDETEGFEQVDDMVSYYNNRQDG